MYFSGINPLKVISKDPDLFWKFYVETAGQILYQNKTGKKLRPSWYGGLRLHSQEEANEILKEKILSGEPFMFGRNGTNEAQMATYGLMLKKGILSDLSRLPNLDGQCEHSGFFGQNEENIIRFSDLVCDATAQSDVCGGLFLFTENYLLKHFCRKDAIVTHTNTMDFWRFEQPFTMALKGKRVLVVHYLAEQIMGQYEKRTLLYPGKEILPEFQLQAIPAVQNIAGRRDPRFKTWFDALDYMEAEVRKQEFDIAILGCGAYGMPLAARIKGMGKQVIYMGGVLQMLFGIRGRRWDDEPKAAALYNEYWENPNPQYKPKGFETVEGGCYW